MTMPAELNVFITPGRHMYWNLYGWNCSKNAFFLGALILPPRARAFGKRGQDAQDLPYAGMEISFKWGGKFNVTGEFGHALFNVR